MLEEESGRRGKEGDLARVVQLVAISLSPHEQQYNAARRQARAGGDWNSSSDNSRNNDNDNNEHGRRYVGEEGGRGDAR